MNSHQTFSPEWLSSAPVRTIFDVFAKNGQPVFAVGGCVRNAVMGIPESGDIDFATPVTPEKVDAMFVAAGYRTEPTGIEHGTVSVIINHVPYEVTTFRKDVETDGRRAVVEFTKDIEEDAERRDFTINALYMNSCGTVYDPWGDIPGNHSGLQDAKDGILRFVGDAGKRIQEDYLRILRLYRFMATLGLDVDPSALWACSYYRKGLKTISGERIEKEVMKLLGAKNPVPSIVEMRNADVIDYAISNIPVDAAGFEFLVQNGPRDAAVRLAYLTFGNNAIGVLDRWKSSTELRRRVLDAQVSCIMEKNVGGTRSAMLSGDASDNRVRARMYMFGKQAVIDGAWVMAGKAHNTNGTFVSQMFKDCDAPSVIAKWEQLEVPVFPVRGQDLINAGMQPGKRMGEVLKAIEIRWISDGFPEKEICLEMIKEYAYA